MFSFTDYDWSQLFSFLSDAIKHGKGINNTPKVGTFTMNFFYILSIFFALTTSVTSQSIAQAIALAAQSEPGKYDTIVSIISDPAQAEIHQLLSDPNVELTGFIPTDEAFAAAGVDVSNSFVIAEILRNHFIGQKFTLVDLFQVPIKLFQSLIGEVLSFVFRDGNWFVLRPDGSLVKIIRREVMAGNSILYFIDGVLLPLSAGK